MAHYDSDITQLTREVDSHGRSGEATGDVQVEAKCHRGLCRVANAGLHFYFVNTCIVQVSAINSEKPCDAVECDEIGEGFMALHVVN